MNNHNRFDILSEIAQDIIDSCTMRRAKLLAKKSKILFFKKPFFKVALTAVLCLAIGLPLLWMLFTTGKQVPVYLGMSLSSEPPAVAEASPSLYHPIALYDSLTPQYAVLAHKEQGLHDNRPGQKLTDDEGNPLSPEAGESIFYANQNEDFYITVHIDNPDNFEIVSFTLNGKKYSSYMFEDGSDMENLILKCNVGDASGIVEYTIDAIKYIDGTAIKDVRLEGDQTVKVGVYTDQQFAIGGVYENRLNSIYVELSVTDIYNAYETNRGRFYIQLVSEGSTIEEFEFTLGIKFEYTFENLQINTNYHINIYGEYDAYDGNGFTARLIDSTSITTDHFLSAKISNIQFKEASYSLEWHSELTDAKDRKIALYIGDTQLYDVSDLQGTFTNLNTNTTYTIKAECTFSGEIHQFEHSFTTPAAEIRLEQTNMIQKLHSVGGSFEITDTFNNGKITLIDLYHKGELMDSIKGQSTALFEYLDFPLTYEMKVTYTFDLKDGKGVQTQTKSYIAVTQSEGFEIVDGVIVHFGKNTDTDIYINMPVGPNAFLSTGVERVVCGENVTYISNSAFAWCENLSEVVFSDTLKRIEDNAFFGCYLKQLELPDGLEYIGTWAFCTRQGFQVFDKVIVPKSVTHIGSQFVDSSVIVFAEVEQRPTNWNLDFHEGQTVWGCLGTHMDSQGCVYADGIDQKYLIGYKGTATVITIEEGTTVIGKDAFLNCESLRKVVLPDGLQTIGAYAFYGCNKLTDINIPVTVSEIGEWVFAYSGIQEIAIPKGISNLSQGVFENCENLISVILPEGMKNIYARAFYNCTKLNSINLPEGIVEIGHNALKNCNLQSLVLPNSIVLIGSEAFSNCGVKYLFIASTIQTIEDSAFYGISCVVTDATEASAWWSANWSLGTYVLWGYNDITESGDYVYAISANGQKALLKYNGSGSQVTISEDVAEIAYKAFGENDTLQRIVLSDSLTKIGAFAFYNCSSLKQITWGKNLRYIDERAFEGCILLQELYIPDNVIEIKDEAFSYCRNLKTIYIPGSVKIIGEQAFACYSGSDLTIYCEATDKLVGWDDNWCDSAATIIWGTTMP